MDASCGVSLVAPMKAGFVAQDVRLCDFLFKIKAKGGSSTSAASVGASESMYRAVMR